MAVAYQSGASNGWLSKDNGQALTLGKPAGLAVGDLMVAVVANGSSTTANPFSFPSNWLDLGGASTTYGTQQASASGRIAAGYKVATSADVAASDFSFVVQEAGTHQVAGIMYRIDGQDPTPIAAYLGGSATNTTSPSFATGITPTESCLLLFNIMVCGGAGAPTVSGYAIVTSNPSWTERLDINDASSRALAAATATRPEATSTGAWSCSLAGTDGAADSASFLIAVKPVADATFNASVLSLTSSIPGTITVSGTANFTASAQVLTPSIPTPTISTPTPEWSNPDKSSAPTWANPDKSWTLIRSKNLMSCMSLCWNFDQVRPFLLKWMPLFMIDWVI